MPPRTAPSRTPVGEAIRFHRERKGLTRTQLGAQAGCSEQSVALWETGRRTPRLEALGRIAAVLGVEVPELVKGDEPNVPPAERTA